MIALVAAAAVSAVVGSGFAAETKMPAVPKHPMKIEPKVQGMEKKPGYPSDPKALFKLLDDDSNGELSRAEWNNNIMAVFFIRDANRDLKLSKDELPGLRPELFDAADLNGDGFLSGYEFNQAKFTQFAAADVDKAGSITEDEFIAFLDSLKTGN
jgi:Ca2+-binding EF-hand superfamily protein